MQSPTSPRKKLKNQFQEATINPKTSITCSNVPDCLFDATTAKKHFSKFGRVQKIRLFPKRHMCIIDYDQPSSAERAVLNAGAYDGFMFDVTRSKARVRRRSVKTENDPDWVPDSDVEEELSAMGGTPTYRITRQNTMDVEPDSKPVEPQIKLKMPPARVMRPSQMKKKAPVRVKKPPVVQSASVMEDPVVITTTQTTLSTSEAALELHQLRSKVSVTPDEKWRILDARDRILRAWGGAGSRIKVGGATIGTCQDMCPEKELLHRQAEHQVMTLETVVESDGELEAWRAVKQYSRSSADQEIPMCYELRPAAVLMRTCAYLLHEVADTKRQVSLADWFHFMWDRFRGIRKDITQQALCCAESIYLVEACARFHAHCAARLADLEHTQFDQKLNTDNLTKCLQTLKHMYSDVTPEQKPREAEFRGYVALLNLGDANFWWEIKQLPIEIQKSEPIIFAIKVFNAIDNNNYVRFFRLVAEQATYLQACILLRYFNDVRARALARIVKAYAPRGGSRFPAEDVMKSLAFESVENLKSFINHYGLRFARTDDSDDELSIILDRNQFIEDSDPYPTARAVQLIESKRKASVGETIAGGHLPDAGFSRHNLYTSFGTDGRLKQSALTAEDQGYNTLNDSNKDINALKTEIQKISQGGKPTLIDRTVETKANVFAKPAVPSLPKIPQKFPIPTEPALPKLPGETKVFSFTPAITVAPTDIIKNSPEKISSEDTKNIFSFSKPQSPIASSIFTGQEKVKRLFENSAPGSNNIFAKPSDKVLNSNPLFMPPKAGDNIFKKPDASSVFAQPSLPKSGKGIFGAVPTNNQNVFAVKEDSKVPNQESKSIFTGANNDLFSKPDSTNTFTKGGNIFAKPSQPETGTKPPPNIFSGFAPVEGNNLFKKSANVDNQGKSQSIFSNGDIAGNKLAPAIFSQNPLQSNGTDSKSYSIFDSKNKAQTVADNIFNSVSAPKIPSVYDFTEDEDVDQVQKQASSAALKEEQAREMQKMLEESKRKKEELRRQEEQRRQEELRYQAEIKRKEEALKKQKELQEKLLEETRRKEEIRKQEELKKKLEEEKKAEIKRKAEDERQFRERVESESMQLVEEIIDEINNSTVKDTMTEEVEKFNNLMEFAKTVTDEILLNITSEICESELMAEAFWTRKIMKKWFNIWKSQYTRNIKRRSLLEDTPVWITSKTPMEEASLLRRFVENAALRNMKSVHKGYKFTGELKQLPTPEPYNIMEIIRSPLLRRMKQISYPYDKCFFWKVTLVSPGATKWLHKKINVENWLQDAFSDKKQHEVSTTLIHVGKQSWNHLMDFAISVSLTSKEKKMNGNEALEGANAVLFYATENDGDLADTIEETLKYKYPNQVIPVAVIIPKSEHIQVLVENLLANLVTKNVISAYRTFVIDAQNVCESLNVCSKSAMKWLAKKYPVLPPLEIDYLKSICQRYLGNEIWCRLRSEQDNRMKAVLRDLYKLIKCYNTAVDKLTDVITNEELFNYSSFPLEFQTYLDSASPYPKPYEFIPSSVKTSDNVSAIKRIMSNLKLPDPSSDFNPVNAISMQQQISSYCNQIGWFENPEEVVCKVVAVLPHELSNVSMPGEEFNKYFAHYNLVDLMNIIVYEKINRLKHFENRFAVYDKSVLEDYRNALWLYEVSVINEMKHKALETEDDIDFFIEAKRRKLQIDSLEYLMLEDMDRTLVDESLKEKDENISKYSNCAEAVKQLEEQIEEGKQKSLEFENLLRAALGEF
ncbi:uncharacterized protein LOC113498627 [Trichoplusia ni]|uniref:Uncharacterized protein LOC113498627 n=1 Tax=Trichoplusia ni TaxID=7111 RepID=A0A7E5W1L2_TRINI|nr:uncharacterized protein LOC113498627 [Trichoplusia ni]